MDDEQAIADLVSVYLENEGYTVYKFYTAEEAVACIASTQLDMAILDVMLPGTDGFTILREIRREHTYPVIMLTAREQELDKINGLALGADEALLPSPSARLSWSARVKAQLRRYFSYNPSSSVRHEDELSLSGLLLNRETHVCKLNEQELPLTPTEFSILWYLCENRGKVISSEELFRAVWGEKYYEGGNNTVMVHIRHIREKMGDSA